MAKPVVLALNARSDLEAIAEWLTDNWGPKVLDNFLNLYEAKVIIIGRHPSRYPIIHPVTGLRKGVLARLM